MRLAVYNVENLFDHAKAMNLESWDEGRPVLEKFADLNALLGQIGYGSVAKGRMAKRMIELGLEKSDIGPFILLQRNRGGLLQRPKIGGITITAEGRADWVGSLELRDEPINEHAMRNTARVRITEGQMCWAWSKPRVGRSSGHSTPKSFPHSAVSPSGM